MGILSTKSALVTGAAQGLGLVQALHMASEGCRVIIADLSGEKGRESVADAKTRGLDLHYVHLDVTDPASWQACLDSCEASFGCPDILVNNAGITVPRKPIEDCDIADWDRIIAVNVKGVFLGIRAFLPHFIARRGGVFVNIGSIAALGQYDIQEPAYATSKGAVVTLTKVVAAQYAQWNIRCNCVCPGPTDSGMLSTFLDTPEKREARRARVPMKRFGEPTEIAAAVAFLASDLSGFTTGAVLQVDGGTLVQ